MTNTLSTETTAATLARIEVGNRVTVEYTDTIGLRSGFVTRVARHPDGLLNVFWLRTEEPAIYQVNRRIDGIRIDSEIPRILP